MTEKKINNWESVSNIIYSPIEPYRQKMMDVGDGHIVYLEECGNPAGIPVLVLHGGPGGGCSPTMRRYFNPSTYRIILFDQRGCGRSRPHASVENNTTWHLVSDIEKIRGYLQIDKLILFGGSWGAALALIYAESFPEHVTGMILRGIFTMTKSELNWVYSYHGAAKFLPDAWRAFADIIPLSEREDLISAYHNRLFSSYASEQEKYARSWTVWENSLASFKNFGNSHNPSAQYAKSFARIENHYFINNGFLDYDNYIERNLYMIKDIPVVIIQGRYDMICPPVTADLVHRSLPLSKLIIIKDAGHAMSELGISEALINATNNFMHYIDNANRVP